MIDGALLNSTNIFFGESQFSRLGNILKEYGERVLVVTGGQSYVSSGAKDLIEPLLASVEVIQATLNGIPADPTADWVYKGVALCRKRRTQAILAIGGGSVIDVAKAIGIATLDYEGDFFDFFLRTRVPRSSLPVGCVLTLAGAGSESSDGCVIQKGHQKYSVGAPFMKPKFAFINTELMLSVDEKLLRYGIADSLSHVLERYFTAANNVATTSHISVALMKSIMSLSRNVLLNPVDKAVRSDLVWAQKLAHDETAGFGRKGDWATHTLAHEVAVLSHAAHGEILSILFPAWLRFVRPLRPELFAFLDNNLLDPSESLEYKCAIEKIVDFYTKICPARRSLSELGIQEKDISLIVDRAAMTTASGTIGNLIRLGKPQMKEILRDAL